MNPFRFASILFCLAAFIANVSAQSPAKILKQAETALGGTKALQSVRSVSKTGRITRVSDGAMGKYIYQTSQPNLINISYDLNGFETETGFNRRSGWTRNSRDGLQTLTGDASVSIQAMAAFRNQLWLNYRSDRSKIVAGEPTMIGDKPANVILLTNRKGVTIRLYFDAVTGLPLRDELPDGDTVTTCDHGDYRDASGVKQAYFNRLTVHGQTYEIRFDDIKINTPIAKSEFDFPDLSGQPLPDIPTLLKELQANEDKVDAMLDTYSFNQKIIKRELGKDGVLRESGSETYQLSFYQGTRMRRLIEKNGKPLSPKEQADEDKAAEKRAIDLEKKLAKQDPENEDNRRISIAEMLRASKLSNPRRERFRGRDVIVFDFEPDPSYDLKNARTMIKFFGKTAGVMWIDERDKQAARVEAVLADNLNIGGGVLAKLKKGASFTLEKERVNDEIWLISQAEINLSIRVLLLKGIDLNQVVRSYDYRKFETQVKDSKIDEVKKP